MLRRFCVAIDWLDHANLQMDFTDLDGFVLTTTFNSDGYTIKGTGLSTDGLDTITLEGDWSEASESYTDLFADSYRIGTLINGQNPGAASFDVGSVRVEAIPEPAVISLIGLFGGGMIFFNRIYGRKKPDSDA